MARSFGEDFKQPTDYMTGLPIPGAPLQGSPSTSRPYNANPGGSGRVTIMPQDGEQTAIPTNPNKATLGSMLDLED